MKQLIKKLYILSIAKHVQLFFNKLSKGNKNKGPAY